MHIAKYNRAAAGHMLKHYAREKDENGKYVTDGRKNIIPSRTHLNYSVGNDIYGMQQLQYELSRPDVKCLNRSDVNVLCDVIVTAPQDLPKADYERFFQTSYDFLCERYGIINKFGVYENVISSYVHMDESQPHMHFAFVPLVRDTKIDKKTQEEQTIFRVNAKKVVSRSDLRTLHPDMSKAMKEVFGRDIGIENGVTKINGNQTVKQLKYKTQLKEEIAELEKQSETLSEQIKSQNKTISYKKNKITQLNEKMADMEISDELHRALSEKQEILKEATTDLNKLEQNKLNINDFLDVVKKWDCGILPPRKLANGNYREYEIKEMVREFYSFLRNLINTIKEFFSQLLGDSYQNELTNIKNEVEQDVIDKEDNFDMEME